jgi:hypothetical protein
MFCRGAGRVKYKGKVYHSFGVPLSHRGGFFFLAFQKETKKKEFIWV